MSAPQTETGMEVDAQEIEPNAAAAAGASAVPADDATMQDAAQAAGRGLTEMPEDTSNVFVTGGTFENPVFGTQIQHHTHYHYHEGRPADQPGPSGGGQSLHQAAPRGIATQESQEYESGDRIVPPQQGQESDQKSLRKLTDKLSVDMNVKNRLSKTAPVYPGYQEMGEFCPQRLTAVKIVPYEKNRRREARNLLKLSPHCNVVLVIHADLVPGSPILKQVYIVMERCQSLTLEEYIEKKQKDKLPFNTKQAIDFAIQIISGLKHIHDKDIVHRDLKPSSVLFSLDGKNLKIIDFGVSKELQNGLTTMSVSTRIGTDGYRAPETYKDKTSKHMKKSADVFSLGILLCHIWSYGVHPFGEDGTLWAHNIKKGNSPDLSNLLIPETEKAKDLLLKMLKVNQDERCTVADVEKHEYIRQGIENTILSEMDEVWSGAIKVSGDDDTQPFDCKLFERKDNNILRLRDQSAQLQMLYVPLTRMTQTLEGVVKARPNGYVALSKDVYLKRLKKKFGKQMGWINAFRNKDRIGSLIIFRPKGYEELVCVFIENPEEFLNRLRVATAEEEETIPEEPAPGADPKPEEDIQERPIPALQPTTDDSVEPADDDIQEEESDHEEPSVSRVVEIGQPEHISWWLYKPVNPGEQASAQTGQ